MELADADIRFLRCFYGDIQAKRHFYLLLNETPWRQDNINVWGKHHLQPRLTAWYGDGGAERVNAAADLLFRTMISCGFSASADG